MKPLICSALLARSCGRTCTADNARPNILFAISDDRDCMHNLATAHAGRVATLRQRMDSTLKAQGDPRMEGRVDVFDCHKPTTTDGLYEEFMRGKKVQTGWVNPTDFEKEPVNP